MSRYVWTNKEPAATNATESPSSLPASVCMPETDYEHGYVGFDVLKTFSTVFQAKRWIMDMASPLNQHPERHYYILAGLTMPKRFSMDLAEERSMTAICRGRWATLQDTSGVCIYLWIDRSMS